MAGKIQNEDIKTQAEVTGAGGSKSQLPNSAKVYLESYSEQKTLKEALDERLLHGTPMEIHQAIPADSKLYFEPSVINTIEGKGRTVPPTKSQIPIVPASTIDFQTGATTGGTFDAPFPTSTIGLFRRLGFSLLSNGIIKGIWSDEAASVGLLANAGTVFVKGALPIGFIDLQATAATAFKTAGSVTNVIEGKVSGNFRIFTFGSGGGGSSGGDTTDFEQSLQRRLETWNFKWVTPNVFSVAEETLVDPSTTATFDIANSEFDFEGPPPFSPIQQLTQSGISLLSVDGSQKVAQTFTAVNSFKLGSITLDLRRVAAIGVAYKLRIWGTQSGAPDPGNVIALSDPIDLVTLPTTLGGGPPFTTFDFNDEVLAPGVYAIVLDNVDLTSGQIQTDGSGISAYAGGTTYFSATGALGTWTNHNSELYFDIQGQAIDGDHLLSIQHYGSRFLAEQRDSIQVEVHALWSVDDPSAKYEISKDGGASFEEITTMTKIGDSLKYRGIWVMDEPPGSVQSTYPVSNANSILELRGGVTPRDQIAIKLPAVPNGTKKRIQDGFIYLNKIGAPQGEIYVKIVADNAGVPGTTILGQSSNIIDITALAVGDNVVPVTLPAILVEGTYWLVIEGSSLYLNTMATGVTAVRVRVDTSGPTYSEGNSYEHLSGVWQAVVGNHAVFELSGYDFDLRLKITASQTASLLAYGVFYGEGYPATVEQVQHIQRFDIDGNLNLTQLDITKFIPDPLFCKVYIVQSGQVLRYPAFGIDGRKLVFASGQFQFPGQIITVLVDQTSGGAFDHSDRNANILATNRLGSTDPSMDFSAAGEGILLRADNGVLVEASLKWNGAGYEWQFAALP